MYNIATLNAISPKGLNQLDENFKITENIDEYVTARRCVPAGCFALQMPDDFCFFLKYWTSLCIFSKPLPQT